MRISEPPARCRDRRGRARAPAVGVHGHASRDRRRPIPTGAAPAVRRVLDVLDARDKALARFRAQARLDYQLARAELPLHAGRRRARAVERAHRRDESVRRQLHAWPPTASSSRPTTAARASSTRATPRPRASGTSSASRCGASELAAVLRGLPPGLGESRWAAVRADRRRMAAAGAASRSGGVLELVVEATSLLPVRVKISGRPRAPRRGGRRTTTIATSTGVSVPHRIEVSFKDGSHLDLVYKSVQRDVDASPRKRSASSVRPAPAS